MVIRTASYYTRPFNGALATLQNHVRRTMPTLRFEPRDDAPSDVPTLLRSYSERRGRVTVWSGASDDTLWGDPAGNWLFRAWHDAHHEITRLGFTASDEILLGNLQAAGCPEGLGHLVRSEIAGQARYYLQHGDFLPERAQLAFTRGDVPVWCR